MRVRKRKLFQKFFADRGTHLAAMIAYFALISMVPVLFLALSLIGFAHHDSQKTVEHALKYIFPSTSVTSIDNAVKTIQDNAATLGIIGGAVLLWSSLSLFSVLESAFNIVYGRPNRSFLHGKALAFVLLVASLVTLIVSLIFGSVSVYLLKRYTGGFFGNTYVAHTLAVLVEFAGLLLFLVTVYYVLTNVRLSLRDVLPGAITAAVILAATFQVVGAYLALVSRDLIVLKTLGAPVILLVWLYLMANVFVFGAEVNWWVAMRREARAIEAPEPAPEADETTEGAAPESAPPTSGGADSQAADTAPIPSKRRLQSPTRTRRRSASGSPRRIE